MFAALLLLLPSNICCYKENKISKIETENLPHIDVGLDIEYDDKNSGPTVER